MLDYLCRRVPAGIVDLKRKHILNLGGNAHRKKRCVI